MTNRASLLKKFGSPEAISEHYKEMQRKSMLNPNKQKGNFKGGFAARNGMTPEAFSEFQRQMSSRRRKKNEG